MTDETLIIGHNNPPDMAVTAQETMRDISAWLSENPVIQNEDHAREAKVYVDRGKLCIKDLEDERDSKVRPLNEQVKEINTYYKAPRANLETVISALGNRLKTFLEETERQRAIAALEARRLADEAEQAAREAERAEQDALGSADSGELGIDIQAAVVEADDAFRAYQKADRKAALAEKEAHVRIGGGFSRALSLRSKEVLIIDDAIAAVTQIGVTESIKEAILTSARAYRKLNNRLPDGIRAETETKI